MVSCGSNDPGPVGPRRRSIDATSVGIHTAARLINEARASPDRRCSWAEVALPSCADNANARTNIGVISRSRLIGPVLSPHMSHPTDAGAMSLPSRHFLGMVVLVQGRPKGRTLTCAGPL